MTCANRGRTPDSSRARSSSTSSPSSARVTWCTWAPMPRRVSRVRSYVGFSTTTASPGATRWSKRKPSASSEPLVRSTWSTSTPCRSATHCRRGGYPTDVPYAVMPAGSASNARAAAALSPAMSMMSSDGAPRAKEMSCCEVMTPQRTGRRCSGYGWRVLLGPHPHDVADRDDAEHIAVGEHDEVPEAAPDHRRGGVLQRPVRVGVDDVPGQVRGRALGVRVEAQADRVQDVAFGHDSDTFGIGVEHHRRAHPALGHLYRDLPERVLRPDHEDRLAHRILDPHGASPLGVGRFAFPGRYGHRAAHAATSQDLCFSSAYTSRRRPVSRSGVKV